MLGPELELKRIQEFIQHWIRNPSPASLAKELGVDVRQIYRKREKAEKLLGVKLTADYKEFQKMHHELDKHDAAKYLNIENGVVLVGSDAHYWPGIISTAHRAFVAFCKAFGKELKAAILNGDVLDGATISRFPPIGWTDSDKPNLIQEMETGQERVTEIEDACTKSAEKLWLLGNHDGRFESKLALVAPQYVKLHGFHLKDHFPAWKTAWAGFINNDVVVKHRFKGGIHATHNNTVNAGKSIITGHLHSLKVTPFSDYNGTRWGVDTGTMADCYGPQTVDYTELNPVNWRSGFIVLTFHKGVLLWPEVVHVVSEDEVVFRGAVHKV